MFYLVADYVLFKHQRSGKKKKELKCKFHESRVSVLFTSVTSDLDSAWHMAGAL